jgi:N-acetylmuramidase
MFSKSIIAEITTIASTLGVEPAALLAVAEVESGGKAFANVEQRQEPMIRFEGHYFDRRLSRENREIARKAGLASPVAGRIANPATQAARWRLLDRAVVIDRGAAYESVSWGLGQVMGAHWAWLGYARIDALVAEARSGVAGQARLMARYVEKAGLSPSLRRRDWAAFARGYNGPDYARNGYDRKIAAAYERYRTEPLNEVGPKPMIATPAKPPKPVAGARKRLIPASFASLLGRT